VLSQPAAPPEANLADLGRGTGKRGLPLTWTGFVHVDGAFAVTQSWIDIGGNLADGGGRIYPQLSPRTVDFRLNWDSSMMFMSMPEGWHRVIAAEGRDARAALL